MKNFSNRLRSDRGFSALHPAELFAIGVMALVATIGVVILVTYAATPTTHYTRFCGDTRSLVRISVDRCENANPGAEWLYMQDGRHVPKMGDDTSDASTRMTASKHDFTTVER